MPLTPDEAKAAAAEFSKRDSNFDRLCAELDSQLGTMGHASLWNPIIHFGVAAVEQARKAYLDIGWDVTLQNAQSHGDIDEVLSIRPLS